MDEFKQRPAPGSLYPMFLIRSGGDQVWVEGKPTGRWELRWTHVLEKYEKQVLYIEVVGNFQIIPQWINEDDVKFCREKFRFPEDYTPVEQG